MPKPDFCKSFTCATDHVEAEVDRALIAAYWQDRTRRRKLVPTWFSVEEYDYVKQLPVLKRQVDWLAGRIAAKLAVARLQLENGYLETPVNKVVVAYDAFNRPRFDKLYLSISHTVDRVVAVAAHQPVGIDVEAKERLRAESLESALPGTEVACVQRDKHCSAQDARALLWSLKEALFKAWGRGAFLRFARELSVVQWQEDSVVWQWNGEAYAGAHSGCQKWQVNSEISLQHVKVAVYEK